MFIIYKWITGPKAWMPLKKDRIVLFPIDATHYPTYKKAYNAMKHIETFKEGRYRIIDANKTKSALIEHIRSKTKYKYGHQCRAQLNRFLINNIIKFKSQYKIITLKTPL